MLELGLHRGMSSSSAAEYGAGGGAPCAHPAQEHEPDPRSLSRLQLLELLKDAIAENERLKRELDETRKQLEDKRIAIEESGSIAEAALRLSGIFEAAQKACDLYQANRECRVSEAGSASGRDAPEDEASLPQEEVQQ